MKWTAEVFNFAAIRDHHVAIAKVGIAGGDATGRIHAGHCCIGAHARHAASTTVVNVRCRVDFTPVGCIHIAIEVRAYALRELALS